MSSWRRGSLKSRRGENEQNENALCSLLGQWDRHTSMRTGPRGESNQISSELSKDGGILKLTSCHSQGVGSLGFSFKRIPSWNQTVAVPSNLFDSYAWITARMFLFWDGCWYSLKLGSKQSSS